MELNSFDYILWAASFIGHILLLAVLCYRQTALKVPTFTALISYLIIKTSILFVVQRHSSAQSYFYAYWIFELAEAVLELAVFAEVTLKIFRPLGRLVPDAKQPMAVIVLLSLVVASALALVAAAPNTSALGVAVSRAELFVYALLSELLAGFVYLSHTAGFGWARNTSRVVLGLGGYALVSFFVTGLQNFFGRSGVYPILSWVQIFAYLGSLAYWLVAFSRKPEPHTVMSPEMKKQLEHLSARWASVLGTLEKIR